MSYKGFNSENARAMQLLGAQKRRENNERRRTMQESIKVILSKSMKKGAHIKPEDIEAIAGSANINLSAQDGILLAQITKALSGDTKAAEFVRDTLGEKPVEKVEAGVTIEDYVKAHKVKF